jgi:preprotein translocase subunit SecF
MNDTIVVFDRIRENLRISRRESLPDVVNRSINQTLSRTVLTSGLTFLTVLCLFVFGGEVLNGFSFALVVGILIGTYSSIAVAAPMLVAWQMSRAGKGKTAVLPAAKRAKG